MMGMSMGMYDGCGHGHGIIIIVCDYNNTNILFNYLCY